MTDQIEYFKREMDRFKSILVEATKTIDELHTRSEILGELASQGAINLGIARVLTEMIVEEQDEKSVRLAVDELKRKMPEMFLCHTQRYEISKAKEKAAKTGDRRSLLGYLRLKQQIEDSDG